MIIVTVWPDLTRTPPQRWLVSTDDLEAGSAQVLHDTPSSAAAVKFARKHAAETRLPYRVMNEYGREAYHSDMPPPLPAPPQGDRYTPALQAARLYMDAHMLAMRYGGIVGIPRAALLQLGVELREAGPHDPPGTVARLIMPDRGRWAVVVPHGDTAVEVAYLGQEGEGE